MHTSERVITGLLRLYLVAAYTFILAPIITTVVFSFNENRFASLPWGGFTVRWYEALFQSSALMDALRNSFTIGLLVATTAVVLGFAGAYGLNRIAGRAQPVLNLLLISPMVVPWLLLGLGLLIFLTWLGLPRSLTTVWIAHTVFAAPLAVVVIQARLRTLPRTLEEAAWDLGANPWRALWHVVLPQAWPGVAAAFLLAFTLSFDEFIMAWFLTGFEVTLPVQIWGMVRSGLNPTINAVGSLVFAVSITMTVIAQALIRRRRAGEA